MKISELKDFLVHPFNLDKKGRILYLILLNLFLKTALILVRIIPDDVDFYTYTGILFLRGIFPFTDFITAESHITDIQIMFNTLHPNGPLNYIFYGFWMLFFGDSPWIIKLPWLISEIGIVIFIFLIGTLLKDINKGFLAAMFYSLNPISYYPALFVGCDELITSLFTVLAVYCFFNNKYNLSAIFLALGTSYKMFPVFGLIPIFFYFFSRKDIKRFVIYLFYFILTYLIIAFPFLLMDFKSFIQWNFSQANRIITISYVNQYRDPMFFGPLFSLWGITISFYTLFQILIVASYFLFRFSKLKSKSKYSQFDFLTDFSFYILILPIISLSNNYRYFFWILPYILLILIKKQSKDDLIEKWERLFNIQILILSSVTIIILINSFVLHRCGSALSVVCYNDYLLTFSIVYIIYGLSFLFVRIKSNFYKNSMYMILGFVLYGFSSIILYEYWDTFQNYTPNTSYLIGSAILLFSAIIILSRFLFIETDGDLKK